MINPRCGLYLRVTGIGGRSWIVKYMGAKAEKMGIGSLADVSLKDARKKADTIRIQARDGINPKLTGTGVSFGALGIQGIRRHDLETED